MQKNTRNYFIAASFFTVLFFFMLYEAKKPNFVILLLSVFLWTLAIEELRLENCKK